MQKVISKHHRKFTLAISLFFCLSLLLGAFHAHASAHEENIHACAVCQASHTAGDAVVNGNKVCPHYLSPTTAPINSEPLFLFSDPQRILTIRGPPLV